MINKLAQHRVYIVSVTSHSSHEAFNLEGASRSPDKPFRLQNQFAPNTQEWIDPLFQEGIMKKLLVWGYALQSMDKVEKMGLPRVSSGVLGISEVFNPKKTHPDFDFPQSWFVKGQEIPPMPEKVYVCLKKARGVTFDFLPYNDFFIMSARFLEFIKKYGFDYDFGMSEAIIVNTKGELLTNKVYYLVRIVVWEIEDEIVYPDLALDEDDFSLEAYTNSDKDILLSSNHNYSGAFMVSENLKGKILEKFSLLFLYSLEEWKELNNLDFYWD